MPFAIYFDVSKMIIDMCRNDASMWMVVEVDLYPSWTAFSLFSRGRCGAPHSSGQNQSKKLAPEFDSSSLKERHQRKYTVVHSTQLISQKSTVKQKVSTIKTKGSLVQFQILQT
ncbi:hypothetical protein NC651_037455 [Populus alba x Populus x berolinensis]|nr:hypothetical protein NC651_037455 [Populus alba x Populus x berolinensis]